MAALLAFVWLKETITVFEFMAMCCCIVGISIVALSKEEDEKTTDLEEGGEDDFISPYSVGIIMAVLATMMHAIVGVTTRRLKNLNFSVILFHYATISTIFNVIWITIVIKDSDGPEVFRF